MKTEQLSHIELEFREGSSDKVYRAGIEEADGGFVVNFAFGRRGTTLNTGTKTARPVPYGDAAGIYEKLVRSKTAKGYKPVGGTQTGAGIGTSVTEREQRDTGLRAQLLNPITEDEAEAYLVNDNWCAQEKFDGKRMMLRKSGAEIVAANRDGLCIGFPNAIAEQLAQINRDFVIDGEVVGETFYAFDLLEIGETDLRPTPYRKRLRVLLTQFGKLHGNIFVAETVGGKYKPSFLLKLKSASKEGVVFKDLRAPWEAGRPASGGSALKCKFWATCSCVVVKVNARRSVEIALGGTSIGNVTIPPNYDIPAIGQVVEIRYLYVTDVGGSLYQPVYLGKRDDVRAEECTMERQRIKYRPLEDQATAQ
jgi:bifunctional non-homologous end joining protein LigD